MTAAREHLRLWYVAALLVVLVVSLDTDPRMECPPSAGDQCQLLRFNDSQYIFTVSGHRVDIYHKFISSNITLLCGEHTVSLESPALPRFSSAVRVNTVVLKECAPPENGSYADVLAALNITGYSELELSNLSTTNLTRAHFAGLAHLHVLDVDNASLALGALTDLSALRTLRLYGVRTPPAELSHLPDTLENLDLWHTGAGCVHINTLPKLHRLILVDRLTTDVNVSAARALDELTINAPNLTVPENALPASLRFVNYIGWNDTSAAPLMHCSNLETFYIEGVNDNSTLSLPDGWVANCPKLTELTVAYVPLRDKLSAGLLANATELRKFTCRECALSEVPLGLFNDTHRLQFIDLSFNEITWLPSGLFKHIFYLEKLDLSHNHLTSAAAHVLAGVNSLEFLRLGHNENLSDMCEVNAYSPLRNMKWLTELHLDHTNITRVCTDWQKELTYLNLLRMNHIAFENLTINDLQYIRGSRGGMVYLSNGREFNLLFTRENYEKGYNNIQSRYNRARIIVDGRLRCNCQTYWAALTFRKHKNGLIEGLKCGKVELTEVDVDTLTCDASEQCESLRLPAHCTCGARDDLQHGAVVIVTCERANLTALPRLPPGNHKWRLHLANNNISTINAADVSSDIVKLDLRNNSIKRIDGEAAAKLANIELQLAGNDQLECGCEAFDMLTALSRLHDAKNVTCTDGKPMTEASLEPCASLTGPVLALLLGVTVVVVVVLALSNIHQRIRTILIAKGWLPPRPEPKEDCSRLFDVFVSFAHEDAEFVVEELAAKLESGPRWYRLCMHYRDWRPGEWIPAQIAASVRSSRRTVAVVSQHYIRSPWARAEFREAHAATLRDPVPRLVVVLLDDPDSLSLDAELNAYIRHNTYVRWGDPWFWEKLRRALPPPRTLPPKNEAATHTPPAPQEAAAVAAAAPPCTAGTRSDTDSDNVQTNSN